MRVAILGCGPAGLMAAHAVAEFDMEPLIYSKKRKSELFGAQYLHKQIPGIEVERTMVNYQLRGSVDDYRRKVYGRMWDGTVSPEDLSENHEAWDIRDTYDRLWSLYRDNVQDIDVDPAGINMITSDHDIVINTIPLDRLCHMGHTFRATAIIAAGDAPARGIDVGRVYGCSPDTVICNGSDNPTWYRLSRIFDHTTVEWPMDIRPPILSASQVRKPTGHNCDCWPDVLKVGRYGSWTKGVLSHSAYDETRRALYGAAAQEARYNDPSMPTLF